MRCKFLILYTILVTTSFADSKAQLNFRLGGLCGSSISRCITPRDYPQNDLKLKVGTYPKVVCRLPLKSGFWFQTEVGLADYGQKIVYKNDSIHQIFKESRYFVQFTELLGYSVKIDKEKRLKLNFEGGPFFGYYLISHQNNRSENVVDHSMWKDKEFRNICREDPMLNKYVVGISAGTGISKEIYRGTILLDFRYDLSLTKVSKYPEVPELPGINKYYYQLFSLSVGYLFGQNKW